MLPAQSYKWQYLEKKKSWKSRGCTVSGRFVSPTFEHTELFNRSVGDTTDVVQKEMYTFDDKGGRSITLRPEGTAGTLRSAIEHGLLGDALPVKSGISAGCVPLRKTPGGPSAGISPVWRRDARLSRCGQRCGSDLHGVPHVPGAGDRGTAGAKLHWMSHLPRQIPKRRCMTICRSPRGTVRYL